MTLRPDALRSRLDKLTEVAVELQRLRELPTRERHPWTVERGLQLGAEIILDIGAHISAAHLQVTTEGYDHILSQLARHHVISSDLREHLQGLGGFRNILVHAYLHLDRDLVEQHFQKAPEVFALFRQTIERWVDTLESDDRQETP